MTYKIEATDTFLTWQSKLKDRQAAKAIALRLIRAQNGNLGDVKSVGNNSCIQISKLLSYSPKPMKTKITPYLFQLLVKS